MLHIFVSRATRKGELTGAWVYVSAHHPDTQAALRQPCITMLPEPVPLEPLSEQDIAETVAAAALTLDEAGVKYTKHNC